MVFIPPSTIALENQKKAKTRNLQFAIGLSAVLGGGYLLWDVTASWLKESAQKKVETPAVQDAPVQPQAAMYETPVESEPSTFEAAPGAALAPVVVPPQAQMDKEAAATPGEPPQSLVQFADNLSSRMEIAESSPEKAKELFKELSECVTGPGAKSNVGIQALCLAHAEELADSYPEHFQNKFLELYRSAPADVSRVLDEGETD